MGLGNNLLKLRKQNHLSQEEVAFKMNVARQTISKWELEETAPDINQAKELAKMFKVSLDTLTDNNSVVNNGLQSYYEYKSKRSLFGLPIIHINVGTSIRKAKGIIAIGNISKGIISIGIVSLGFLSLGAVSIGLLAIGGFALGLLLSLGGLSIGTFAIGGLAIGIYSIGGVAIAKNIAFGGCAIGHIAIGDFVNGTKEFITNGSLSNVSSQDIRYVIIREFPNTWNFIITIFSFLGT